MTFGEPKPEHFGITAEQIETHRQRAEKQSKKEKACVFPLMMLGFFAVAVLVGNSMATEPMVSRLVTSFFAGLVGGPFCCFLGLTVLNAYKYVSKDKTTRFTEDAIAKYHQAVREWKEAQERARRQFWKNLSGRQFEAELAKLLLVCGYDVERTPMSGDAGVDLWLTQNGEKTAVQCKRLKKPVGVAAARDLFGTMLHHRADRGILASVSGFTSGVRKFIGGKPITLLGLNDILHLATTRKGTKSDENEMGMDSLHGCLDSRLDSRSRS